MAYKYIAIEGNIGAGKSTLAQALTNHYNALYVPESFADNNFLPKFYKEPERYAFPLELSFLADRYKQLSSIFLQSNFELQTVIADYMLVKSKLFAMTNLDELEFELFQQLYDIINAQLPQPDLLLYLHAPLTQLRSNIIKRGREYEQNISDEYLLKLQDMYTRFLDKVSINTMVIDIKDIDFIQNPAYIKTITDKIDSMTINRKAYLKMK